MLFKHKQTLTYCSNIFKENNWITLFNKLNLYIINLKKNFKKKIGLSLCLSNVITKELAKSHNIIHLQNWLKKNKLYIASLNGFVYQTFHKKKIKERIYFPDWTSQKRVNYTKKLIGILYQLQGLHEGSISTLPISYSLWTNNNNKYYILYKASKNIIKIIDLLISLKTNNKLIHLDIEPEPYCTIDTYNNLKLFFENWLVPICKKFLKSESSKYILVKNIYTHIRLCYDICHFSVNFENHQEIIKSIKNTKIKIGKIQVSSALKLKLTKKNIDETYKNLLLLKNSPFLHQVTLKKINKIKKYTDISYLLKDTTINERCELRIHFHMPTYIKHYKNMITTHNETKKTLKSLLQTFSIKHIEIETYTHNVIYNSNQIDSITKEYLWVLNILKNI